METKIFAFEKPGIGERALGLPWKPIAELHHSRRHSHSVSGSAVAKPMRARADGSMPWRHPGCPRPSPASSLDPAQTQLCVSPGLGRWKKWSAAGMDLVGDNGNGLRVSTWPYSSDHGPPARWVNKSRWTATASCTPQPRCRLALSCILRKINRTNYTSRTIWASPENPNYWKPN